MPKQPRTKSLKTVGIAYVWFWTLGLVGGHQFYIGNPGRGTLYIFTLGLCFIGWFWDMFTLPKQVQRKNDSINMGNLAASTAAMAQHAQQQQQR